jgi:thioesterase domain-containing protein
MAKSDGQPAPTETILVPIRTMGTKRPLFCVHTVSGSAAGFIKLAQYLPADLPVYGLQAPELASAESTFPDITTRAVAYLRALRAVQPQGPYRLLGYSFGGAVAVAIARLLEDAGETVERLLLQDSPPPLPEDRLQQLDERQVRRWLRSELQATFTGQTVEHGDEPDDDMLVQLARDARFLRPTDGVESLRRQLGLLMTRVHAYFQYERRRRCLERPCCCARRRAIRAWRRPFRECANRTSAGGNSSASRWRCGWCRGNHYAVLSPSSL